MTELTGIAPAESISVSDMASFLVDNPTKDVAKEEKATETPQDGDNADLDTTPPNEAADATEGEETGPDDEDTDDESEGGDEDEVAAKDKGPVEIEITLPDGEKVKMTPDELAKSYLRQADYTKKTQEVAETRKLHENIVQQYEQRMTSVLQQLEQKLIGDANAVNLTPQEWEHLKQTNVAEYLLKRDEMQARSMEIQQLQQTNAQRAQQETALQKQQRLEHLQQQESLLADRITKWKDPVARAALQTQLAGYLAEQGYGQEVIDNLADARAVELTYKAMQWDALQKSKPLIAKRVADAPKVARPGSAPESGEAKRMSVSNAAKRLSQTGKVSDMANYLLQTL